MQKVVRAQYRAALQKDLPDAALAPAVAACRQKAAAEIEAGRLLTGGVFRCKTLLFAYMEYLAGEETFHPQHIPDEWFAPLAPFLCDWPALTGPAKWAFMYPVFWVDEPQSPASWARQTQPDARCGRIAVLYPDKLFSYVCHHQALVAEGLLVGDRYQFISLHENILFSYFETPRDRERVNIRRSSAPSQEIERWKAADPPAHFYHFPAANGADFLIIPTLFDVGR